MPDMFPGILPGVGGDMAPGTGSWAAETPPDGAVSRGENGAWFFPIPGQNSNHGSEDMPGTGEAAEEVHEAVADAHEEHASDHPGHLQTNQQDSQQDPPFDFTLVLLGLLCASLGSLLVLAYTLLFEEKQHMSQHLHAVRLLENPDPSLRHLERSI